jgi:hypothetical protein
MSDDSVLTWAVSEVVLLDSASFTGSARIAKLLEVTILNSTNRNTRVNTSNLGKWRRALMKIEVINDIGIYAGCAGI